MLLGISFMSPEWSLSSSVAVWLLTLSSDDRMPGFSPLSVLLVEFPSESLPRLRVLENIADKPFRGGDCDLSMVKDIGQTATGLWQRPQVCGSKGSHPEGRLFGALDRAGNVE